MAFVNEYISKEDEKKFIAPLDLFRKLEGFPSPPYNWTRDASYDSWLDDGTHGNGKNSCFGIGVFGKLRKTGGRWIEASQ